MSSQQTPTWNPHQSHHLFTCPKTLVYNCDCNCWSWNSFWIGTFVMYSNFMHTLLTKGCFLTTAKLVRGLSDVATANVCKVDTSSRNHIERSRWMKWLITGLRQKKYPLIWIHYESPLLQIVQKSSRTPFTATCKGTCLRQEPELDTSVQKQKKNPTISS